MFGRWASLGILAWAVTLAARPAGAAPDGGAPETGPLPSYAADTWRSLTEMVQPSGLPADGLHRAPDGTWTPAPYTSPTNIAAYLWGVLSAEALGLVTPDEAGLRIRRTLTALEGMDRSQRLLLQLVRSGHRRTAGRPGRGPPPRSGRSSPASTTPGSRRP